LLQFHPNFAHKGNKLQAPIVKQLLMMLYRLGRLPDQRLILTPAGLGEEGEVGHIVLLPGMVPGLVSRQESESEATHMQNQKRPRMTQVEDLDEQGNMAGTEFSGMNSEAQCMEEHMDDTDEEQSLSQRSAERLAASNSTKSIGGADAGGSH
ncbi:hypothetical protein FBU31_002899, partial [Coemansia sp. 'formosensis']